MYAYNVCWSVCSLHTCTAHVLECMLCNFALLSQLGFACLLFKCWRHLARSEVASSMQARTNSEQQLWFCCSGQALCGRVGRSQKLCFKLASWNVCRSVDVGLFLSALVSEEARHFFAASAVLG